MKSILIPLERYHDLLKRANHGEANDTEALSLDIILEAIPKNYRNKAKALLDHVAPHLKWNDRGEITCDGRPVTNSSVTDLVKDLSRRDFAGASPPGAAEFYEALIKANVPMSLIANLHRRERLRRGKEKHPANLHAPESPSSPSLPSPSHPSKEPAKTAKKRKWIEY